MPLQTKRRSVSELLPPRKIDGHPRASVEVFGIHPETKETVHLIKLECGQEDEFCGASIITLGAALQSLCLPDVLGNVDDVVLGFHDLEGYLGRNPCFGATPGRYANRISNGRFKLEGEYRKLNVNWKAHTLHGGAGSFDHKVWKISKGPWVDEVGAYVTLSLHSPAGDQGFHAAVDAHVTFRWTLTSSLEIEFSATSDRATVMNLTNHSYFNLAGVHMPNDVLCHELQINADKITEVNEEAIPTGHFQPVQGTIFDFQEPHAVGDYIDKVPGGGYDHNYCVNGDYTTGLRRFVARLREPSTGRRMEVWATQPGVQLFTANGDVVEGIQGKYNCRYRRHAGICLETQHYPDSPNHDHFPEVTLTPGQLYMQSVAYRFSCGDPF